MAAPDNMPDASVKKCAKQRAAVVNRFIHYTWRCLGGGDLRGGGGSGRSNSLFCDGDVYYHLGFVCATVVGSQSPLVIPIRSRGSLPVGCGLLQIVHKSNSIPHSAAASFLLSLAFGGGSLLAHWAAPGGVGFFE